jgi:hypothetical protein
VSGLLKALAGIALRRGFRVNSRAWLGLAVASGLLGWMRQKAEEPPEVVHREELRPGQRITISVYDPPR